MKYEVKVLIEKTIWAEVEAKNKKEAEEKAFSFHNIMNELTDEEEIKEVEVLRIRLLSHL